MGVTKFQIVQPRDGLQRNGLTGIDFDDENRCPAMSELFHTRAFCFLLCASMTIVFTTATEYTELLQITNPVFPGLMIGTYFVFSCADKFMTLNTLYDVSPGLVPLAGGIGSFGWQYVLQSTGFNSTFMLSSIIGCIGSILYGLALVFNSPATLFICRVLIGLSGSINLFLEYYAVTIGKKKLKENINTIWAIGTLGLGFGPIASASIGYIFGDLLGLYPQNNKLFNTVTIPGWFMACLYLTQAVIFCFAFKAPTKHEHAVYRELQRKQMPSDNKSVAPISMIDVVVLGALLFCIFAAGVGVGGIETRTAFVAQAQNEDHTSDAIAW
eukprot:CAMPEP_0203746660 /NCGR_PEP_ID=MMETSP0098-20131031/2035_1 /ASSEMBLY_ACC=CAM_ASM_000208 /TAXON_ID=96639 /ORGANISM=" , Strain NY0313808BC1" /LENGTH=326 /DNA_ID=CAMNT_0050634837 /DNA_START=169 /DNA_END=1145 /DNA_ORIENTATION=-